MLHQVMEQEILMNLYFLIWKAFDIIISIFFYFFRNFFIITYIILYIRFRLLYIILSFIFLYKVHYAYSYSCI